MGHGKESHGKGAERSLRLREVQPERYGALEPSSPQATRHLRDLGRLHRLQGTARFFARELARNLPAGGQVWELGAGDGRQLRALEPLLSERGCRVTAVDRTARPEEWPDGWRWVRGDVAELPEGDLAGADALLASYLLHELRDDTLAELGEKLRAGRCGLIVAQETRRERLPLLLANGLILLGAGRITRADAFTSVRAGFREDELARLLGLAAPEWTISCGRGPLGTIRLVAKKRTQ